MKCPVPHTFRPNFPGLYGGRVVTATLTVLGARGATRDLQFLATDKTTNCTR